MELPRGRWRPLVWPPELQVLGGGAFSGRSCWLQQLRPPTSCCGDPLLAATPPPAAANRPLRRPLSAGCHLPAATSLSEATPRLGSCPSRGGHATLSAPSQPPCGGNLPLSAANPPLQRLRALAEVASPLVAKLHERPRSGRRPPVLFGGHPSLAACHLAEASPPLRRPAPPFGSHPPPRRAPSHGGGRAHRVAISPPLRWPSFAGGHLAGGCHPLVRRPTSPRAPTPPLPLRRSPIANGHSQAGSLLLGCDHPSLAPATAACVL